MGLFRRDRKSAADDPVGSEGQAPVDAADTADADDAGVEDSIGADIDDAAAEERYSRTRGPFDMAEVEDDDEVARIDLGSLLVPPVEGMQLRLELDQEQTSVVSAHALLGDSGVQLQVFAAPRTLGVWPDIRTEIADSVLSQGGSAEVVDGPLGRELVAGIPSRDANGRTVQTPVRFLGVDGPRWFLRAVISGPAATDEAKAEPLVELVRSVVVVRDEEARPPREALPMRVPAAVEEAAAEAEPDTDTDTDTDTDATATAERSADDLRPFERGPEITEVR